MPSPVYYTMSSYPFFFKTRIVQSSSKERDGWIHRWEPPWKLRSQREEYLTRVLLPSIQFIGPCLLFSFYSLSPFPFSSPSPPSSPSFPTLSPSGSMLHLIDIKFVQYVKFIHSRKMLSSVREKKRCKNVEVWLYSAGSQGGDWSFRVCEAT